LWQGRFYSCPLSGGHLATALRYVEQNPCRAGMVASAEEYRWSSAAAHLGGAKDVYGVLDLEFWERSGGISTWAEMYGVNDVDDRIEELRRCTYGGGLFGEQEFVEKMEQEFGRVWRDGKSREICGNVRRE